MSCVGCGGWLLRRSPPSVGASLPNLALVLDQPKGGGRDARAIGSMGVVELDVVEGRVLGAGGAVGPVEAEPACPAPRAAVGQQLWPVLHTTTVPPATPT